MRSIGGALLFFSLAGYATRCDALNVPSARQITKSAPSQARNALVASSTSSTGARSAVVAWGICGFLGILASAINRLLPLALQPLIRRDLSMMQWLFYGGSIGLFSYVEGYQAFQNKFSPLVVERAMTLRHSSSIVHIALAPFYSMGLMHATKKRKIVSWSVSFSVAMVVSIVKRLPYPWRSIVDAGVCAGLGWGAASIAAYYVRALAGSSPGVDACLP
eukprot:CAMPEP_0115844300 /NCGR_PEP_ID=MMETSP0287-20121206/8760_1 /TAXON_ID=412157 /ORGANISM="Chrysochromulina rotalis, Strain UIO044" /LENGTH=218 /DNA_ID=CAMNT_0003298027 /DNA_START=14 /DNA_END=670 /DNA_ORIENTATION=+